MRLNCFPIFSGTAFSRCAISVPVRMMRRERLRRAQMKFECALDEIFGIESRDLAESIVLTRQQERAVEAGPHHRRGRREIHDIGDEADLVSAADRGLPLIERLMPET